MSSKNIEKLDINSYYDNHLDIRDAVEHLLYKVNEVVDYINTDENNTDVSFDFEILIKVIQEEYKVVKAIHTKKYNFSTIYYQKPDEDVLYVSSYRGKEPWSHVIVPKDK